MINALLYVSSSQLSLPDQASEVDAIVAFSQIRNPLMNVTGALVFTEKNFAQYLEGPAASVEALMESIRRDRRHRNIDVAYAADVAARRFETWAMAYAGPSTFVAAHVRSLIDTPAGPGLKKASDRLITLMRQFVEAQLIEERRSRGQA
jgi:hypothetical protein